MQPRDPHERLNQINTLWSQVRRAHDDTGEAARAARHALLDRYGGAIHRYLLGALRDEESANDLAQDFAYRFLHGDLRGADPTRGRFRDFVKGVLFHMVADYHSKRKRLPTPMSDNMVEPGEDCTLAAEREAAYRTAWRDELFARAWLSLEAHQTANDQPFYTVLRFRADHPDMPSHEMAEQLTGPLGKSVTAAGVRKTLERARDKFHDLLLEEIAQAVDPATRERVEEELIELELLEYLRTAVERRFG